MKSIGETIVSSSSKYLISASLPKNSPSIDNYGAKYADLFLFSEVKFDTLKLDRELVHKLETDEKTCMISKSVQVPSFKLQIFFFKSVP